MKKFVVIMCIAAVTLACNMVGVIEAPRTPQIELDSSSGVYSVKVGRELVISPSYLYNEGATYSWTIDGVVVCTEPSLRYSSDKTGSVYVTLRVANDLGDDAAELRIDVVEMETPSLSLAGAAEGFTILKGEELPLSATMSPCSIATSVEWLIDGEVVGEGLHYTFVGNEVGKSDVAVYGKNEDGECRLEFVVDVVAERPFAWTFERDSYRLMVGRTLRIEPITYTKDVEAVYTFCCGGDIVQQGALPHYDFTASTVGEYKVAITATIVRAEGEENHLHTITITTHNEDYQRPVTATSKAAWSKVYEYMPAPGQFINDTKMSGFDDSQTSAEAAVAYAEKRLAEKRWVSLGGFGGYIVVGFDHSIVNGEGYDLAIEGNTFEGSSEAGVVWVMQDENGDGLPNDMWYELAGSESGKASTIQNYSVTYYRPSAPQMAVQWRDSEGRSGEIDYLKSSHNQPYYYPMWVGADSYTLRGTRLKEINYDESGNGSMWVLPAYDWGYVDNMSSVDLVQHEGAQAGDARCNIFKLENAVDATGKSVQLSHIDFVKVQCACNTKSGWLGEMSTEVVGVYDYTLLNAE